MRNLNRRQFLSASAGLVATQIGRKVVGVPLERPVSGPGPGSGKVVVVAPRDGAELQAFLSRRAGTGATVRIVRPMTLTLPVREDPVGPANEKSIHALLVPEGVRLDLNQSTLLLELKSNSYGVRLSNDSAILQGEIRVVTSEGKGSQACWHSGVSVGAAYGDGGTTDVPGQFSQVKHFAIQELTIDQPFAAAAIQFMSEAAFGVVRNVTIKDSPRALLGVGLDWGSVGPITSEDRQLSRMRRLWEQGQIYSTHPHDILIEGVRVGRLTRNQDGNDAGVRCSACHNITIRDLKVEAAASAIAIFGGDLGYEFARDDLRNRAHQEYLIDGVVIERAFLFGLAINGLADNVWRARRDYGYDVVRDPTSPGIDQPVFRNLTLRGSGRKSQGIYAVAITQAKFDQADISGFEIGVHAEDWVDGLRFRNTKLTENDQNARIEGVKSPAQGVEFIDPA
ncbi:MAG: hypothetical protein NT069_11700 [Planctomycetota bacterium]|nr:hypothetical protein [Planctomycetota bacterium]